MSMSRRGRLLATVGVVSLMSFPLVARADDAPPLPAPAAQPVEQVIVTTQKSAVPDNVPAVVEGVTAQQIQDSVNAITSAETLKYLPSIEVRERYIGDRNGIVATRTTGTVSSAESMVYGDNLLLSNFLGNSYSYPPRWGLVTPQEIERVDVIYGPFSALYPGNSMGGVITMTTRMPDKPEAHVDLKAFDEVFKLYGTGQHNEGGDGSASFGNRIGNLSYWADFDHLDSHGHPMSFATATPSTTSANTGTRVTGYYQDTDQNGNPRYVFGAYSIDHTLQDQGKLKLAYDVTPEIRATYTLGIWSDDSHTSAQTYLTNTVTGQPFWNGSVNIGGHSYTVSGVAPGLTEEFHVMNAVSVKSDTHGIFDWEAAASKYTFLQEDARSASSTLYGTSSAAANSGTDQKQQGTGWETADLRGIWRPLDPLGGKHEVSFGYHIDVYKLDQLTYATNNWQGGNDTSLSSSSVGQTQTQGLYVQDAYKFLPDWTLTVGARDEFWTASNGTNYNASDTPKTAIYPSRSQENVSPKASLAYEVIPPLTERFSVGQAYRYPTVNELFQAVTTGSTLVVNDPNLKPEQVMSYDWTSEYTVNRYSGRVSLFQEDRRNALFSQTDTTVTPNLTQVENVDKVRIRGVELAGQATDVGITGFDLMGSVTYTHSETLADAQYPTAIGKNWPRIPDWRAKLVAVYHQNDDLTYSAGLRYAGKSYSTLNNADTNGDVYGGISSYLTADLRVNYKLGNGFTAALGVDNATDDKYFVSPHPYPQVTLFSEVKYDY
jgi:iron complex outermembrane receptor protein